MEDRRLLAVQALSLADPKLLSQTAGGPSSLAPSSMSDDGRYLVFTSAAQNLVANKTNGDYQVFLRDLKTGTTSLVSATPDGNGGNGYSADPVISGDGRFVAFDSYASDLVSNDTNNSEDVFVRNLKTGTTSLVSATPSGTSGNNSSSGPVISAEGRFVAFTSDATDLLAKKTNGNSQVFERDLTTGTTTLVSATPAGNGGNGYSYGPVMSADGRFVAFTSYAGNLVAHDHNGASDVFVRDVMTAKTILVSATPAGASGNSYSDDPTISADGRFVAFASLASDLVANDNNGNYDVFVRDLKTATTSLVSAAPAGASGNGYSYGAVISANGQFVAFSSYASDLVANDHNNTADVFVRNLTAGTTTLASATPAGASGNNYSFGPVISASGRFVAFSSYASDLVANDNNGTIDVFVRDMATGATSLVSATSSGASGNGYSSSPVISADGDLVAFASYASNLVPQDHNDSQDVFVRNLDTNKTTLVSRRDPALPCLTGNGYSDVSGGSVSADGRFVAFTSYADNLTDNSTNGLSNVFVRDRKTGTTTLVSVTPSGAGGNGYSYGPVISADGSSVAFVSSASDLVPNDNNGNSDVFVRDLKTGITTLVSATPTGNGGNGYSSDPVINGDGQFVAFDSYASDLVPNDANNSEDVFVRNLKTGTTTLVSATPSGTSGNSSSYGPIISANGGFVAFTSFATDLVANQTNGDTQVFERDFTTGTTALVSATPSGTSGNSYSWGPVISAEGRFVAFTSYATDLVANQTNGDTQVFERDLTTGTTTLVSVTPAGNGGNGYSSDPAMSANGRFVSFTSSSSDLVANDNNGNDDVFVRDLKSDTTTLVSATPNGASGNGYSYGAVISANGRYVAFTSYATDLVANTTNGDSQVFERDLKTGTTTLVSVTPAGNGGNGYSNGPVMSADGLFVAFTSYASDLVPGDYNGASDVFGYRLAQSSGDNGDNSGNGGSAPSFAPAMVVFGQAAQGPLAPPHRPAQRPQAAPNRDQPPGGSVAKRALVLPQSGDAFERAVTELPHWANLDDPFLDDVAAALPESSCKRVAGGAAPQAVGFLVEAP